VENVTSNVTEHFYTCFVVCYCQVDCRVLKMSGDSSSTRSVGHQNIVSHS